MRNFDSCRKYLCMVLDSDIPKNETLEEHRQHCDAKPGNCPFEKKVDDQDRITRAEDYEPAPKDALYMMVKLDDKTRDMLLGTMQMVGPNFQNVYADHLTLAYGKSMDGKIFPKIGTGAELRGKRIIWDDKAMAVIVQPEDAQKLNCQNKHPHITLSTEEEIKPVYSNELAEKYAKGDKSVQSLAIDGLRLTGEVDAERKRNVSEKQKTLQDAPFCDIIKRAKKIAQEVENGNGIHQRLPKKALSGMRRGGRILEEATAVARVWETPSGVAPRKGQRDENARDQRRLGKIQEQKLEEYAKSEGIWDDNLDVKLWQRYGYGTHGAESLVYFDDATRTVHKLITTSFYREPIHNFDRIALHNYVFPDTPMTVVGFGKTRDDWRGEQNPMFVMHVIQPYVEMKDTASQEILSEHMKNLGFSEKAPGIWVSDDGSIKIDDLHEENAVLDKNNHLRVIDDVIFLNTPEADFGGKYKVNEI